MLRAEETPAAPEAFDALLQSKSLEFGLPLSGSASQSIARYLSELDRWRRRINLTGALSLEELAEHALESALASPLIIQGERLVDVGSGAGFPGMVLAILRPDVSGTLVEPRRKRAAFLRHVSRELALANARVVEDRIENVGGQTFDVATTRAVGNLARWIGEAAFLRPGGTFLCWTTDVETLARELPELKLARTVRIPGSSRRQIAAFQKPA